MTAPHDDVAAVGRAWLVVDDRGNVVSRHRTEAAAWAGIERRMRRTALRANRPGMQGGGYASIQYAVCAPSREAEPPA